MKPYFRWQGIPIVQLDYDVGSPMNLNLDVVHQTVELL